MSKRIHVLVGTSKGVFMYVSDEERQRWELKGPFLNGWEAYSVLGDSRHGNRIFAGTSHTAYGPAIRVSEDFGETWRQIEDGPRYAPETGFAMNRIWQLVPGAPSQPDTLYAGAEDAGLFVSHDRGETWRELDSLTKHPTRPDWFGGAGGMCLHTILTDPNNPQRIWVAISAVGVFRSDDGGETWKVCNRGLNRVPTGQPDERVGFCIHKMVMSPFDSNTLYMQEHCGVFMSTDGGDSWVPFEEGLTLHGDDRPFGFPIAVGPNGDLFLIPLESSEKRSMAGGKLLVWSRRPGDERWEPIGDVVPDEQRHVSVLRDAMAVDTLEPYGLYFGTNSGELFCSLDRGVTWSRLPGQLSRILCVKPWVVEV
ncbi:hypothetical protein SD70_25660 [Gordoniibacillus kamchatkensis]|uniref:Exo-alpha-sialidase n=1 Tax=Gordoniibacillus kamchatkensis TaxID=1590651 RepID=A0ABR5ABV8_9BACL|nr:sialidase family protein [Paenibacillus sp. VKM B-2647]KIL38521.1 hypothetical protein SD70_25660 [Paenibacillus sp. VKM B-2647]